MMQGMDAASEERRRTWEETMPIYITQGRYTREAIKGMIVRPEDRADAVSRLLSKAGARMMSLYFTFGEYDFLLIAEAPERNADRSGVADGGERRRRHRAAHDAGHDHDRGQGRICRGERSRAAYQGPGGT